MTRKGHQDTKTLQLWPGGASYTYRGDLWGPASRRSLMTTREVCDVCKVQAERLHCGHPTTTIRKWRKGTVEEWRQIRVAERARRLQREEMYCCDSALITDLSDLASSIAGEAPNCMARAFAVDEWRNLYADPSEWDGERCREYAEENGVELPELPECPNACEYDDIRKERTYAHDTDHGGTEWSACDRCMEGHAKPEDEDADWETWLEEARDACRDHAQDHPAEVFEWYRVSRYLCELLHEVGEVTIDNDYGYWWGRCTTGQNNLMDGVLQRCAMEADEQLRPGKGAGA